jgi:hypothetical protein
LHFQRLYPHCYAIRHRSSCCQALWLSDQAAFTKEFVGTQERDNGILALLGHHRDFDLAFFDIEKSRLRRRPGQRRSFPFDAQKWPGPWRRSPKKLRDQIDARPLWDFRPFRFLPSSMLALSRRTICAKLLTPVTNNGAVAALEHQGGRLVCHDTAATTAATSQPHRNLSSRVKPCGSVAPLRGLPPAATPVSWLPCLRRPSTPLKSRSSAARQDQSGRRPSQVFSTELVQQLL